MLDYIDASEAAVILPFYAVLFLLAIPLIVLPSWTIAMAGVVCTAVTSLR